MTRLNMIGAAIVMTVVLGIVGCQMFDDSPTEVAAPGTSPNADFIMGTPEVDGWGAYYEAGGSFVRVDIPVSGAIKIDYSTTSGWSGAIFGSAGSPLGVEIGIKEDDIIDSVCISYVEGGSFSSMPANVEEHIKGDWTHYKRVKDDGSLLDWWPTNAKFVFSGDATTACSVINSEVQWDVIPGGAFDKPNQSAPSDSGPLVPVIHIWVTDTFTNGRLTSIDAADNFCRQHGMPSSDSNVRALISFTGTAAQSRCPEGLEETALYRKDGTTLVAEDWNGLWDGALDAAVQSTAIAVWTGSTDEGLMIGGKTCNNWNSNSDALQGEWGWAQASDGTWMDASEIGCAHELPLYCISW